MDRKKLRSLATHLTLALLLLAGLWLFISDKNTLAIGSTLILAYVASVLAFCVVPKKKPTNKNK